VLLCDGKRTVEEIVEALAKEYSAPANVIRADVLDPCPEPRRQGIY
jgi:hypothetical protein